MALVVLQEYLGGGTAFSQGMACCFASTHECNAQLSWHYSLYLEHLFSGFLAISSLLIHLLTHCAYLISGPNFNFMTP